MLGIGPNRYWKWNFPMTLSVRPSRRLVSWCCFKRSSPLKNTCVCFFKSLKNHNFIIPYPWQPGVGAVDSKLLVKLQCVINQQINTIFPFIIVPGTRVGKPTFRTAVNRWMYGWTATDRKNSYFAFSHRISDGYPPTEMWVWAQECTNCAPDID